MAGLLGVHAFAEQQRFTKGGRVNLPVEFWSANPDVNRVRATLSHLVHGPGEFVERLHDVLYDRAMKQCARELLLAQSSDWAFIMKTGTMVPYAVKRTQDHILRFTRLYEQIKSNTIDTDFLGNCEWRDNIFPNINWRYYI